LILSIRSRLGERGRMFGRRARGQLEFFVCASLRDLVPDDHILARVDRVLDLGWLHEEVSGSMRMKGGRGSIRRRRSG
jgi:hypothetical protein